MQSLDGLLTFLMANANLFMLVAVAAMIASYATRTGSWRTKRIVAIVSLCACTPLLILYGLVAIRWPSEGMNFLFAGLWGYNVWASWKLLRSTRPATFRRN